MDETYQFDLEESEDSLKDAESQESEDSQDYEDRQESDDQEYSTDSYDTHDEDFDPKPSRNTYRNNRRSYDTNIEITEEEMDKIADTAIDIIKEILIYFDAEDSTIEEYEGEEKELIFDVVGDNLAMLIGRHGKTLEAMQYLVSAIVTKRMGYHYPIVVDVEGYINRRKQKLIAMAKASAARAIRQKRFVSLRPMSAYERRIVHMALKDDKRVKTESEGIDPNRLVVIYPA